MINSLYPMDYSANPPNKPVNYGGRIHGNGEENVASLDDIIYSLINDSSANNYGSIFTNSMAINGHHSVAAANMVTAQNQHHQTLMAECTNYKNNRHQGYSNNEMNRPLISANTAHNNNNRRPAPEPGLSDQSPIKRKRKRKTKRELDVDYFCSVCQEKSAGHSFYGGQVCRSCRAFFRRSVVGKSYDAFVCGESGSGGSSTSWEEDSTPRNITCNIEGVMARTSCKYCRFQKCLESGMRISWVLSENEINRRRSSDKNKDSNDGNPDAMQAVSALCNNAPIMTFTEEEKSFIKLKQDSLLFNLNQGLASYFRCNDLFIRDLSNFAYFGGLVNENFLSNYRKMGDCIHYRLLQSLSEIADLPANDVQSLLKANGPTMFQFKMCVTINENNVPLVEMIHNATQSGEFPYLVDIKRRLRVAKLHEKKPLINYYIMFQSPWGQHLVDEKRHMELLNLIKFWPRDTKRAPIDKFQWTLMTIIISFNVDFNLTLERRDLAEQLQTKYSLMLFRYLKFKYGSSDGNVRFMKGLYMISYAKEAQEIVKRSKLFK